MVRVLVEALIRHSLHSARGQRGSAANARLPTTVLKLARQKAKTRASAKETEERAGTSARSSVSMSVVIPHRVNALREVAEATSIKIVADAEAAGKPGSLCVIELHHLLVTTNAKLVGYKKYKRELAQNVVNAAAEEISPATNRHIVEVVRLPMQPC